MVTSSCPGCFDVDLRQLVCGLEYYPCSE